MPRPVAVKAAARRFFLPIFIARSLIRFGRSRCSSETEVRGHDHLCIIASPLNLRQRVMRQGVRTLLAIHRHFGRVAVAHVQTACG